jgi:hypothetical protein
MQLRTTGTIKIGKFSLRFTNEGKWLVTVAGRIIGEADTLDDAATLTVKERARILAQLHDSNPRSDGSETP